MVFGLSNHSHILANSRDRSSHSAALSCMFKRLNSMPIFLALSEPSFARDPKRDLVVHSRYFDHGHLLGCGELIIICYWQSDIG